MTAPEIERLIWEKMHGVNSKEKVADKKEPPN